MTEEDKPKEHELGFLLETSYPLLKKFRDACPGTFKHSQLLAGMIENISEELGLDPIFMKCCAMYHDIGKMHNPKFFTENTLDGEDMHDGLDPLVSYHIISSHVAHSTNILLNDENFPQDMIRVVSQHHGNCVIEYFFNKAKKINPDIDKAMFRYKCTRPKTLYALVLMVVDHIEATSRSLYQANKLDPINVIETTINNLLYDGQLDDVTMKLGSLKNIKVALAKELEGIFQKRVNYDEIKDDNEEV